MYKCKESIEQHGEEVEEISLSLNPSSALYQHRDESWPRNTMSWMT